MSSTKEDFIDGVCKILDTLDNLEKQKFYQLQNRLRRLKNPLLLEPVEHDDIVSVLMELVDIQMEITEFISERRRSELCVE